MREVSGHSYLNSPVFSVSSLPSTGSLKDFLFIFGFLAIWFWRIFLILWESSTCMLDCLISNRAVSLSFSLPLHPFPRPSPFLFWLHFDSFCYSSRSIDMVWTCELVYIWYFSALEVIWFLIIVSMSIMFMFSFKFLDMLITVFKFSSANFLISVNYGCLYSWLIFLLVSPVFSLELCG